jgi:hypothetical protein
MNFMDKIMTVRGLDVVVRLDLGAKAEKIICVLIEMYIKDKDKFYTFAGVHRRFGSITTEDSLLILTEFERCGMVVTKNEKGKIWYKYNDDITKFTNNSEYDIEKVIELKKAYEDKLRKKIERVKRFLKEIEQKTPRKRDVLDQYIEENYAQTSPEITLEKTALELHEAKECDPLFCRFCAMEQNKDIEF